MPYWMLHSAMVSRSSWEISMHKLDLSEQGLRTLWEKKQWVEIVEHVQQQQIESQQKHIRT